MIISISRRTDVPAFYTQWLQHRFAEGWVQTVNPYNTNQRNLIYLDTQTVDGIVFWSKNPAPLLPLLPQFKNYPWYLQCTITGYQTHLEPNIPSAEKNCPVHTPACPALWTRAGGVAIRPHVVWLPVYLLMARAKFCPFM